MNFSTVNYPLKVVIKILKQLSKYITLCAPTGRAAKKLSESSGFETKTIHRWVALHFIENPENKQEVNHKDGNKLNNSIDNLEWVTSSDNSLHAFRLGLRSHVGEKNSRAILTIKDVILIRKIIKCGFSDIEIGFMFGVNPATIYKIKNISYSFNN